MTRSPNHHSTGATGAKAEDRIAALLDDLVDDLDDLLAEVYRRTDALYASLDDLGDELETLEALDPQYPQYPLDPQYPQDPQDLEDSVDSEDDDESGICVEDWLRALQTVRGHLEGGVDSLVGGFTECTDLQRWG